MTKAALRGATCLSIALLGSNAYAQDAVPQDTAAQAAEDATTADSIVVTGSRISTPNLQSANPVAIVTGEQIFSSGNLSVGDQLNELPMMRSTYSQANSTRFLGTRGLNLLDLRGLGTQRTLVLVNGRRHVGSDVLVNATSVDVNSIPADLIDRVDVVTGGASGVYGSDAIAGVVNFILKEDYEGLKLRAQNGVSTYGDAGKQYASILAGKNFADGRGNITFSGEFSHSEDFYASGRPGLARQQNFIVTDTDPAGSPNGSDGIPDRTFYNDIRSSTISLGGLVAIGQGSSSRCGNNVSNFTCTYLFQPDGTLIPQTGERIGIGPNGNFQGGNGTTGREGQLVALSPDLKRYTANLTGHYEISPALVPFFEAKYSRTEARGSQSGPFFSQGTTLGDPGGRERVRLDNPYLSTQARDVLTAALLATPGNANGTSFADILDDDGNVTTTAAAQLAAQRAAIAAGTYKFNLRRNWTDFGNRDEEIKRETFRIVGGLRGDFNDDWHYEVSANYGEHKESNIIRGNVNVQRYLLAMDSTRDAAGNIVCRSQINPAAGISYITGETTGDPRLAGDIASCVPLNPFGQGSVSQAAKDYILVDSMARGKMTQLDLMGFMSGDTSAFFNLPGGPVAFSVGGEYRRETVSYDLDDLTQEGYAFYNAIPSFTAPAFKVKEVYGEILLPLLADKPFFEDLSLRGNGRISDYAGATGTVYTYGGEAIWSPVSDIKFRGTYSRSVRAPNLVELYSAQGQNFAPGFVDPCSERNLATGSANRVANCNAAGRPAGYDFVYAQSLEIVSGGNPELKQESSDSITIGTVIQPRWIPGLSISVDYWNIKVKDVISSVDAQTIANLCYDSATLSNPFCGLFQRAGAGGGPNGEVAFQILEGNLLESTANFAKLKYRGIDTQINYDHTFDFGRLSLAAYWTHYLQKDEFTDPSDPTFKDRLINELNDPSDEVTMNASFQTGPVKFSYGLRWIDKMYLNTYEDYNSLNGNPPQNEDYAPIKKYKSVFYHDVRLQYSINKDYDFYVGADNVFNKMPPYGLTGVGAGSSVYPNLGRYFYAGITANF
ncbi:TonB-dependent receptor domain-containing protein [Novosphingobium sp. P6W]|uniref:TonB-dependent receptor domain-containing protein n=1 Tax=Novosphingobium sp. P6W TaxID=1609758 RepID=UPI0009E5F2E3|nr:TonB-dependent receptor [Novosphingobium sp. P6W]AXB76200.1 TonB-dependent receptor [Novosphingobium sp. P6W]